MSKPFFTTDPDASAGPITYQLLAQAWAQAQLRTPRMNAQVYGLDADIDNDEHIPGQLCTENPFCEECYS